MKKKILNWFCIITGLVFTVSGFIKVANTAAFGDLIVQYELRWLQFLSPLVVIIEIAVGISLILKIRPKIMGLISAGLLLTHTVAITYGHFKIGITGCDCLSTFKILHDNIVIVLTMNIILLVMSLFVWFYYRSYPQEKTDESKLIILLGVLFAGFHVSLIISPH